MTVLDVIQKSTEFLTRKGVESPRLQVELLLGHILKLPRLRLYLEHDRELTPPQVDQLRELVKRRGQREPLQHIVGTTSFCGRDFIVNKDVLIPRPETELLAEYAWKWLGSRPGTAPRVLDFGTGSGCLAVTMALQVPKASVTAIDLSAPALAVAKSNATKLGAGERIEFRQGDGFSALAPGTPVFDLIVSNPPYIEAAEIATLEPEVRDFDPRCALDGGADGLDFYRRLAIEAPRHLAEGGRLMMEFGEGQAAAITKLLSDQMWIVDAVEKDYTQRERFLVARRNAV